jgi:hypothetical protein
MNWSNAWAQGVVFVVVSLVVGGLIGWGTAVHFARESAKDTELQLKVAETQTLMLKTLLIGAEKQGAVKLARDAKGDITGGQVIELQGNVQESQDTTRASGYLTPNAPPPATHK